MVSRKSGKICSVVMRDTSSLYIRSFGPNLYTVLLIGVPPAILRTKLSLSIESWCATIHAALATMTAIIYGEWAPSNPFPNAYVVLLRVSATLYVVCINTVMDLNLNSPVSLLDRSIAQAKLASIVIVFFGNL